MRSALAFAVVTVVHGLTCFENKYEGPTKKRVSRSQFVLSNEASIPNVKACMVSEVIPWHLPTILIFLIIPLRSVLSCKAVLLRCILASICARTLGISDVETLMHACSDIVFNICMHLCAVY